MRRGIAVAVLSGVGFFAAAGWAQEPGPRPPADLTGADHPWDNGTAVDLEWALSPDDASIEGYAVFRRRVDEDVFDQVTTVPAGTGTVTVTDLGPGIAYVFRVAAVSAGGVQSAPAQTPAPVQPSIQWFDGARSWFLVTLLLFCGAVVTFIVKARRGAALWVRKIAGLEAVDEAVGRATEMGRSCLFVPGIQDMNDIQTIAGLNILARVSRTAAEYDAKIEVPTCRSLVMTAARETVGTSFLAAGRPDAFDPDSVYYVTDEQFGYVAYLQGKMVREKPAACFYMGSFFAESLILAEMGNAVGAIQVAGTAQPAQLPFFVAACDYTLIGEEFFAASAYLSGEPDQLGSLKGQDAGKLIVAAGILAGSLATTAAVLTGSEWIRSLVDYFTGFVLT